jgi:hypothetical protein
MWLIGAGSLGRLYDAALTGKVSTLTAVYAEQAAQLGLAKAALAIWGIKV